MQYHCYTTIVSIDNKMPILQSRVQLDTFIGNLQFLLSTVYNIMLQLLYILYEKMTKLKRRQTIEKNLKSKRHSQGNCVLLYTL